MTETSHRFGVLTPSSNTALEPLTCTMLAGASGVSAHFSRFQVTRISLDDRDSAQFELDKIIAAAKLLEDAKVDVIGWSGTSASWLGFDHDEALCDRIQQQTNIPAATSILALNEVLNELGVDAFGLVTPYTEDVQARIIDNYQRAGMQIIAEQHLGIQENFAFAQVSEQTLTGQVSKVVEQGAPAVVIACTNLKSAHLVSAWEQQFGVPIFDTTTTVVWKMLRMIGYREPIQDWGSLLSGEIKND